MDRQFRPVAFCGDGSGETLAAASGKCMASIRQYIVNAVAVNVSSAEKMATRQITRDQLVTAMSDYSSALMTEAGQLPYLNDITLSNAEAVYWERIYSKKTKTYRYEYSVLYPFPEQTRRQLIEAFVAIDDAKQAEYERLRRELGTITDIDRIRLAVNELDGLYDYFFDATRKGDVETCGAITGHCTMPCRSRWSPRRRASASIPCGSTAVRPRPPCSRA